MAIIRQGQAARLWLADFRQSLVQCWRQVVQPRPAVCGPEQEDTGACGGERGVRSGRTGVLAEDSEGLVSRAADLHHIRVQGLTTVGPRFGNPEDVCPCLRATRKAFQHLVAVDLPGVEMSYLSMGMSNSHRVAIAEGANVVCLGTLLGEEWGS
jgi:hypothetical protein